VTTGAFLELVLNLLPAKSIAEIGIYQDVGRRSF
jgi:hypothetical protein